MDGGSSAHVGVSEVACLTEALARVGLVAGGVLLHHGDSAMDVLAAWEPGLVREHWHLAERPDRFWASSLEALEERVLNLLAQPEHLLAIPMEPWGCPNSMQGCGAFARPRLRDRDRCVLVTSPKAQARQGTQAALG